MVIQYEKLLEDPSAELQRVAARLGFHEDDISQSIELLQGKLHTFAC